MEAGGDSMNRHCEQSEAIHYGLGRPLDCFVAAAERQFILSAAAGGVEGLLAMTGRELTSINIFV